MLGLFLLTLRELRARKVVIGLFVVATVIWVAFTFALQLDVVDGTLAGARLFGQETLDGPVDLDAPLLDADGEPILNSDGTPRTARDDLPPFGNTLLESVVFGAQAFVAGAAYWVGILLALFATGGLVAALTERGQVDVLLTKPLSRASVLAGRLLAVMAVMLALTTYLFGGVWLVMSIKSGLWAPQFLLAIPVVFGMFAVVYGVVTLVGVWSGSGPLSFIATLGVLFVSLILAIPTLPEQVSALWRPLVVGAYQVLPKFGGVGTSIVPQLATGGDVGALSLLWSSLAFGAVCYGLAFVLFSRKDF
ncbi:hypothetical protein [Rubrivirga sp.]|uniref:hypothetical protein n=1 Tax=Rubrivirga sp. TaxID=1885344 RepID=UPI003B51B250